MALASTKQPTNYYQTDSSQPQFRPRVRTLFVQCYNTADGNGTLYVAHYLLIARHARRRIWGFCQKNASRVIHETCLYGLVWSHLVLLVVIVCGSTAESSCGAAAATAAATATAAAGSAPTSIPPTTGALSESSGRKFPRGNWRYCRRADRLRLEGET